MVKIRIKHPGEMNLVAKQLGYEHVTQIPQYKLHEYARRLVEAYGKRSALGMVQVQLIFRKHHPSQTIKFRKLHEEIMQL